MYIIVGLGNPGREYATTRHNVGFMTVDLLANQLGIKLEKLAHKAITGAGMLNEHKLLLAKPQTFMNLSGEAVQNLVNWYKIEPDKLILIYDDIDLEVGELRIRSSGSAGTHNGMRSVICQLQRDDFPRIRVGIGKAKEGWELASYVLSRPEEEEQLILTKTIKNAADAVKMIITGGVSAAQAKYNKKPASQQKTIPEKQRSDDNTERENRT